MLTIYRSIAIATALSMVLEQVLLSRLARYLWTADSQFGFKRAHGTEMAIFALKQAVDFYRNQDTPVYMCFLDANKAFDRVNHWTLAKKLLDRNVPLHIVKLSIFWYREQEFMVRWGNSLPMIFRCANGIRQGWQLSPLLYNVYTDDLNHHLQATGVGYYVGGAWVNSLSYGVTYTHGNCSLDTLGGISRICWTSWHCIQHNENSMYAGPAKAIIGSVLNKSQARKWGT